MYIEQVKAKIAVLKVLHPEKYRPCTEREVRVLEERVGLRLPLAYKECLLFMGHGADGFLSGSDFFYPDLDGLQEDAAELLIEDHFPEPLPADAFVFFMHQGYQFNFFRTSEGDDPPVYRFYEGKDTTSFALIYPHFTAFLIRELTDYAWYIQKANERAQERK